MRQHDVVGHVVNVAARVAESARGGEVLATGAVRDAVGRLSGVSFGRLRHRAFKGVAEIKPERRGTGDYCPQQATSKNQRHGEREPHEAS